MKCNDKTQTDNIDVYIFFSLLNSSSDLYGECLNVTALQTLHCWVVAIGDLHCQVPRYRVQVGLGSCHTGKVWSDPEFGDTVTPVDVVAAGREGTVGT